VIAMRALGLLVWAAFALLALRPALRGGRPPRRPVPEELVKDPVCQTYVVRSRAVSRRDGGEERWFCSTACARRFAAGARG
jgi:YHS domain-containing protein